MNTFLVKSILRDHKKIRQFSTVSKLLSGSQIHIEELTNGVKIATEEVNSPLTCTSLIIQTGSRFENYCNNGISNFIEHMTTSSKDIQEKFYDKGIKMTSATTREFQRFSAIGLNENVCDIVEAFSNIITNWEWDDNEINQQKNVIKLEAYDYDNNIKSLVFDYLHQTAFQETPLSQSVIGPMSNLAKFNRVQICNFMKENYQAHRILLVSSGGESHSSIMSKVNSTFSFLSSSECKILNEGPQRYTGSEIIYRDDSMPFAHVAIAVEAPGVNSQEYFTFFVASCLTNSWDRTQGGADRHASLLARAVSTSRLCESFESFYIAYQDVGLWGIYFIGNPKNLDDVVSNIQDQWMQMCTMIVQSDVERAVNLAKLKLARRFDGVMNSCYDIGFQLLYKSKRKSLYDLYAEVSKVTVEMIKNVSFNYIFDKCPVVAAIGPTETLPHYNRIRSGFESGVWPGGRTSEVVWESSHSYSYALPVFEEFLLKQSTFGFKRKENILTDTV